ncbi:ras family protein [Exophiala viscosa]|uniref:Ras family protein n=1 Tax=Exophiala viscosa TaxID=2486360 RepID=A0AAN6IC51_9EURO|nr:ras family protein [Exophiala viscosa]KAI1619911.1 ras family protein [Exophiala viscosa]
MADKISITICGDGGCGKSSITLRLVRSQWTSEYDPTIEDSYSVTRTVDGLNYYLSLTDTAGQEEYRSLWAASNLQSDAFLLVYDITNAASLEGLSWFLDMIDIEAENREEENSRLLRERGPKVRGRRDEGWKFPPIKIMAGNKCDLKDARVVSSKVGWEYAKSKGCGFMETSAREMVNIEETFALIVRRVVEARRSHGGGRENTPQYPTYGGKGHTPNASGAGSSAYQIPSSMQTNQQSNNPNTLSMGEKSDFEDDGGNVPWWKKIFCCR